MIKNEDLENNSISTTVEADGQDDIATEEGRLVEIPPVVTVGELSDIIDVEPIETIKQLMRAGLMLTMNEVVEFENAAMIAQSFGLRVKKPRPILNRVIDPVEFDADQDNLVNRTPIVTILGHVDHGKTTLLDAIRDSNVTAREAGGITQHIGAYQVEFEGNRLTFLDTPGHEAFTAMRARGAQITDIAVLLVAADDGIMPQTLEAIDHVKAAGVPMVVAINKIDRSEADQERVKRQLAENDLLIEEWGGDVISVPVSALKREGISELLENIQVVAEVGDLKADPDRPAQGIVVEARIDKSRGPVATLLVQTGTLRTKDILAAGEAKGRVRAMLDDAGKEIVEAGPSVPVEVMGLGDLPQAGDVFKVVRDDRTARDLVEKHSRDQALRHGSGVTLEDLQDRVRTGASGSLDLIVKTDVQGTMDAVRNAIRPLSNDEIGVNLLHVASGSITESDVMLAVASEAVILGFNVSPQPGAALLAKNENVEIRNYDVIYELIDDVRDALSGMLVPETRDVVEGVAIIRAVFGVGRKRKAAGIYVEKGRVSRGAVMHVMRSNKLVFEGPIASLKHFKDDVREITAGLEGGLALDGFSDYQEGDIIESHRVEEG